MTPATGRRVRNITYKAKRLVRAGDQERIGPREGRVKKIILAAAAGITAVGAVSASAATLGGINADSLGVDDSVIAACDTDGIDVAYTLTYSAAGLTYNVDDVILSDVAVACDGLDYSITLAGAGGTALDTATGVVALSGDVLTINVSASTVSGEDVEGIAVAILG